MCPPPNRCASIEGRTKFIQRVWTVSWGLRLRLPDDWFFPASSFVGCDFIVTLFQLCFFFYFQPQAATTAALACAPAKDRRRRRSRALHNTPTRFPTSTRATFKEREGRKGPPKGVSESLSEREIDRCGAVSETQVPISGYCITITLQRDERVLVKACSTDLGGKTSRRKIGVFSLVRPATSKGFLGRKPGSLSTDPRLR